MTTISLPEIAEIVWRTTAAWRITTCHRGESCPTGRVPYGNDDPYAELVAEECIRAGCLDLVHDLWLHVNEALGRESVQARLQQVSNLGGYVRQMVTRRMADIRREERVKCGFPAKPNRSDGAPGRVIAELLACGGRRGPWLVQLFRILRSYPFGPNHVSGRWPVNGLLMEHQQSHGQGLDETQVLADIQTVLGVARTTLGDAWVHDNLTLPTRSSHHCEPLSESSALVEPPTVDHVALTVLLAHYDRLRSRGRSQDDALRQAVRETFGIEVAITGELRAALKEFRQAE
ncbi:MAG: hypothetical protein Q4D96_10810 [Propionibacteriaceae bacterium]|nr:hypothetical protein [Propionibacteriaceae bacterium]